MNKHSVRNMLKTFVLAGALGLLAACGTTHDDEEGHGHDDGHAHEEDAHGHGEEGGEEAERGPHGGRLLEQGDFALELTIFESGVPPEFRLYPLLKGAAIKPEEVSATVELTRVNGLAGGQVDRHTFTPREDYLVSAAEVYEPHSFDVKVQATYAGSTHEWQYESPEGRVTISQAAATSQGVETAVAAPGVIAENLMLYGRIQANAERLRAVTARFAGVVESVEVQVGDTVRAGQTLATVESNESLRSYAVTSPIAGTVVKRDTNPGQSAGSEPLFEIANFGTVWAELSVFPRDRARLKAGQSVAVTAVEGETAGTGRIAYVSPVGTATQALVARVVLDNASGQWAPGQFVNGAVSVAQSRAALVVPLSALQTFRDWDVVVVNEGEQYQLQPVGLGRRDATHVEVLEGLAPGARVVVANSYLIKADVEKSGAAHDH